MARHIERGDSVRIAVACGIAIVVASLAFPSTARGQHYRHPLDPLSAEEIRRTVAILEADHRVQPDTRFALIDLYEPPKEQVRQDLAGGTVHRAAYAQMYDWRTTTASEAVVDLDGRRVVSWTALDSREPPTFFLVFARVAEIIRADPRWHQAMRRRGIPHHECVCLIAPLVYHHNETCASGSCPAEQERENTGKLTESQVLTSPVRSCANRVAGGARTRPGPFENRSHSLSELAFV
jgi:Cu2+-containing amine oxidase